MNCVRLLEEPAQEKGIEYSYLSDFQESETAESRLVYEQTWEYQIYDTIRASGEKGILRFGHLIDLILNCLRMTLSASYSAFLGYRIADKIINTVVEKYNITSTLEHHGKSLTSRLQLPKSDLPAKKDVRIFLSE